MKTFAWFLTVFIIFRIPALAQDSTDHMTTELPSKVNISITPMATLSCPNFKFGDNYSAYWGDGAKACVNTDFLKGNGGFDLGLSWYYDQFKAHGIDKIADMNSGSVGFDMYEYCIISGINLGASQFDAGDAILKSFGEKTVSVPQPHVALFSVL